jgi:hypothetical protein
MKHLESGKDALVYKLAKFKPFCHIASHEKCHSGDQQF